MKYKVHFVCGVLLCGSAEGAMAPAGRALVPQGQLASQAGTMPAALRDTMKITERLKKEGKVHYMYAPQPISPAATLDKQKFLEQAANKTLETRKSRVNILSKAIKSRYVDDMSYPELILDIFVDVPLIKSTLYALCIDTAGCSVDIAVKELNEMHRSIPGMRDWVTGTEAFPVIEELRQQSCRFDKLVSILHDNMGMLSLRNDDKITGSTLDGMVYKASLYPQLSEAFRNYLMRKDKQDYIQRFLFKSEDDFINLRVLNAIAHSKYSMEELNAVGNSRAFAQAVKYNPDLVQRLKDYKARVQ